MKGKKIIFYNTPAQKKRFFTGLALNAACFLLTLVLLAAALVQVFAPVKESSLLFEVTLTRVLSAEEEGYTAEDNLRCEVEYATPDGSYSDIRTYTWAEWEALPEGHTVVGYVYEESESVYTVFESKNYTKAELSNGIHEARIAASAPLWNAFLAALMITIGATVMVFFGRFFTLYEKIWFLGILILAGIVAVLFPEENINGINGLWIMALYLADTFLNILCELLISKQSKWNFIVSVFVEITEILTCILLAYRFATMAVTLFFWLPIDIISFVNWHKHPDQNEDELTEVRRLRGWQEALVIAGIVAWTIGVGYLLTTLDLGTDLFGGNRTLEVIVCYLDACASAVGIANGLFILFRLREQWIAWCICSLAEAAINILSGQYVLLVLKFGYLTNTTYGYVKWTKYIKSKETRVESEN